MAITQVSGWSNPIHLGNQSCCTMAIAIPTAAITAPTDRSMFRVTMIRTIPVAMIATTAVCTERFQMFRGVRNVWPGVMMWKTIQMIASARSIPASR